MKQEGTDDLIFLLSNFRHDSSGGDDRSSVLLCRGKKVAWFLTSIDCSSTGMHQHPQMYARSRENILSCGFCYTEHG